MTQRAYVRGSGGKFAGAGAKGTKVTYGKAGGFANAAFRSRVLASRSSARPPAKGAQKPTFAKKAARLGVAAGSGVLAAGIVSRRGGSSTLALSAALATTSTVLRSSSSISRPKIQAGGKVQR